MRVLDVRQDHRDHDIKAGRQVLQSEIARPATTLLVVRGTGAEVSALADRAAGRSDAFPWREVVWVRDDDIFTSQQRSTWFGNGHAAVVLGFDDRPAATLDIDAGLFDIELAYSKAQQQGGGTS